LINRLDWFSAKEGGDRMVVLAKLNFLFKYASVSAFISAIAAGRPVNAPARALNRVFS
jgi:hypothetical protein